MFSNLDNLTRFVAVVDQGTVHKAAEKIGLTQPAITRSIKMLEAEAGAPLFERRARGVHLTPLGERALAHARHILRECTFAREDVLTLREGESGTMRIAAAPVWMSSILPGVVAELQRTYPHLVISLKSVNYSDALPLLQNGETDIFCGGFQRNDSLSSFLVRKPLFTSHLTVVARCDHPILALERVAAEDLLAYSWLSYQSEVAYLDMIMEAIAKQTGQQGVAAVQCESMLTALELLRKGDYLAFLPSSFITSSHGSGLTAVSSETAQASFQSGMIYRRNLGGSGPFEMLSVLANEQIKALGFLNETPPN